MSELQKLNNGVLVSDRWDQRVRPANRQHQRSLARIERRADLEARTIELQAELGVERVHAVVSVGTAALTAQTLISGRERLLVESEASAIHGVAFIGQKLMLALGAVVDGTVEDILR